MYELIKAAALFFLALFIIAKLCDGASYIRATLGRPRSRQ